MTCDIRSQSPFWVLLCSADQPPRWVVRPGTFPFDPPGLVRLTGLAELAALFADRAAALATGAVEDNP